MESTHNTQLPPMSATSRGSPGVITECRSGIIMQLLGRTMYSCFTCTSIWSLMLCMLSLSANDNSHIHNTRHLVLLIHGLFCSLRAKSICPLNFPSNTHCITIYFRGKAPSYEAAEKRAVGAPNDSFTDLNVIEHRESHCRVMVGEVGANTFRRYTMEFVRTGNQLTYVCEPASIALVASHPPTSLSKC